MKNRNLLFVAVVFSLISGCSDFKKGDLVEFTNSEGLCGKFVENDFIVTVIRDHKSGFLYRSSYGQVKVDKCPIR